MISHSNWSRRATVWRASIVVEKAYTLGQHSFSPVLNRPSEFFKCLTIPVSVYCGPMSHLRDCLIGNWQSPTSFFIVNFRVTSCKLPTPLTDVFDILAWISIHFHQLAMNFDRFNAFCIQKPNYCSNFAPGGSIKWKLHFKRLPSQDWAS